MDQLKLD